MQPHLSSQTCSQSSSCHKKKDPAVIAVLAVASEQAMPTAMSTSFCCLNSPSLLLYIHIQMNAPSCPTWVSSKLHTWLFWDLYSLSCSNCTEFATEISHPKSVFNSLFSNDTLEHWMIIVCRSYCPDRAARWSNVLKTAYACSTYLIKFSCYPNCSICSTAATQCG